MLNDTIAAIATGMTPSGIGIIRISGEDSRKIIRKIYRINGSNNDIENAQSHTIHYGYIYDAEEVIDEVLVMIMDEPRSYTGENSVEIQCHGGILSVKKVLETVIKYGARPAEPGEFTKRAYLHSRIDLSQAEAVMDLINAKSEYALKNSLNHLKGSILNTINAVRDQLITKIAYMEAAMDDPENYSLDGYSLQLRSTLEESKKIIEKLLSSVDEGKMIKEGIKTVIVGKPNVGKSSLLNLLIGEDRAIVTDVAGTTRDTLEEMIVLEGLSLRIIDTAGIRDTEDVVEKIGVKRARDSAKDADLILYVVDASTPLDNNDEDIMKMMKEQDKKAIILLNKTDLKSVVTAEELKKRILVPVIAASAKEKTGIEALGNQIKKMFFNGEISFNDEIYITSARQKFLLHEAKESLELVLESIDNNMPEDLYTVDLMSAYDTLGRVTGEVAENDELANEIFTKFCTGK